MRKKTKTAPKRSRENNFDWFAKCVEPYWAIVAWFGKNKGIENCMDVLVPAGRLRIEVTDLIVTVFETTDRITPEMPCKRKAITQRLDIHFGKQTLENCPRGHRKEKQYAEDQMKKFGLKCRRGR